MNASEMGADLVGVYDFYLCVCLFVCLLFYKLPYTLSAKHRDGIRYFSYVGKQCRHSALLMQHK